MLGRLGKWVERFCERGGLCVPVRSAIITDSNMRGVHGPVQLMFQVGAKTKVIRGKLAKITDLVPSLTNRTSFIHIGTNPDLADNQLQLYVTAPATGAAAVAILFQELFTVQTNDAVPSIPQAIGFLAIAIGDSAAQVSVGDKRPVLCILGMVVLLLSALFGAHRNARQTQRVRSLPGSLVVCPSSGPWQPGFRASLTASTLALPSLLASPSLKQLTHRYPTPTAL